MQKNKKFNNKGEMQQFPGNTIVSSLYDNKEVLNAFQVIQSEYRALPFAHKYHLLPESSVHMTIFELLCHFNRKVSHWSKHLILDEPIEKVDRYFHNQLSDFQFPNPFEMKPLAISNTVINVTPINDEIKLVLKNLRDQLSNMTGVRFPNHDTYQFHITFAYKVQPLTELEEKHIQKLNESIHKKILSKVESITIDKIEYTIFEDMSEFAPYGQKTRELLRKEKGYSDLNKVSLKK